MDSAPLPIISPDHQCSALDREGFVLLPAVMDDAWIATCRTAVDGLVIAEGARAGVEAHQEDGTDRLANLVGKGACFRWCLREPRVLAAVRHVLGQDAKLSSLNFREPRIGQGRQALHADWDEATGADGPWQVCNTVWLLDPFIAGNGATRLVPGSHRWRRRPTAEEADGHPDEVLALAPAGSVLVFNSHIWHGGAQRTAGERRRALFAYFTRRGNETQTDHRRWLEPTVFAALDADERELLGP